jgi:5'-nucleotidase
MAHGVERAVSCVPAVVCAGFAAACFALGCAPSERPAREPVRAAPQAAPLVTTPAPAHVRVKLLGLNDFHGQLSPRVIDGRPVGGAAVLASYLKAAAADVSGRTFIVHAGDQVGASPPNSALLQDEPAITFLSSLADDSACAYFPAPNDACNVIGTFGNHEFDEGRDELMRLLRGGNHADGPFLEATWRGARFGHVSANVLDAATDQPIAPPYTLRHVDGVTIAFVGAVLKATPTIVTPAGVQTLRFLDEADAVNRVVAELKPQGVRAFVLLIHQGAEQPSYEGPTRPNAPAPTGELVEVIRRLDDEIDVIVSGHSHQFTNALVPNSNGKAMLVTEAFSAGRAFHDIDLALDRETGDIVEKSARIVTAFADAGAGLVPDAAMTALVASADARVAPMVDRVVAEAATEITRATNAAGESALGGLIADAQRRAVAADFAVINPGGIRSDLRAGRITWGNLFTAQPFRNTLITVTLTGQQLYDLLNEQWGGAQPEGGRILQVSGFSYVWDSARPEGSERVLEIKTASGRPIVKSASYRIVANQFLVAGGDNFSVLHAGTEPARGPVDLDALVKYVGSLPQPLRGKIAGRITRR